MDFIFVSETLFSADVILIAGVSRPELAERAALLFRKGLAPLVLPSGGPNRNLPDWPCEWAFLRDILIKHGVPEPAILREDRAAHTFDNAQLSWQVLRALEPPARSAILVCKTFHSRRALMTYQQAFPPGFIFGCAPVRDERDIGQENWYHSDMGIKAVMSEVAKIGMYFEGHVAKMARSSPIV